MRGRKQIGYAVIKELLLTDIKKESPNEGTETRRYVYFSYFQLANKKRIPE